MTIKVAFASIAGIISMSKEKIPAIVGVGGVIGERMMTNMDVGIALGRKNPAAIDNMVESQGIGVKTRGWVEDGQATSDLAVEAIKMAANTAGLDLSSVKALILATSTGDYGGLPNSAIVHHKLDLPKKARACDIVSGCTGGLQALEIVINDVRSRSGMGMPQIMVAADAGSPFRHHKHGATATLFGDGAGAVVIKKVRPEEGVLPLLKFGFRTDGSLADKLYIPAGGSAQPATHETVDKGLHTLYMDGLAIKEYAVKGMTEMGKELLKETKMTIKDIDFVIVHQANKVIIDGVLEGLGCPLEKTIITIDHTGNTSSATIFIAMSEGIQQGRIKRNHNVLMLSAGSGAITAGCLMTMIGLPKSDERTVFIAIKPKRTGQRELAPVI